ncbi:phage major capsid protein [Lysinibacillus sp. FSL R7-0073]|uniref:phage major capsid protein n=1 Tax=Lysinibacillus sp. FSL R7-0073 TaxID=2921669 RepID=UPI0030F5C93A
MTLKQLMISKKIEQRKSTLVDLMLREEEFQNRSAELVTALEEAKTEEEISTVESQIDKLDSDKEEVTNKKSVLEDEIKTLETELEQLNSNAPSNQQRSKKLPNQTRGEESMNRLQVRELLKTGEYYERSEVKEFYEQFKNLRAVTGGELAIPEVVVNRIMDIMGDFTTLYPLVDKVAIKGTTRILVDTDTTAATWMEQTASIPTGDVGTITKIDFDGFKVGKVTFVDNSLLNDSIVNLDDYVTKKIARAIAKALDIAIVSGTGAANKQPTGIVPSLKAGHKVEAVADEKLIKNTVKHIGLIDTGEDTVGEIAAVMKRSTYYNRFLEFSIQVNAEGNVVGKLPNLKQPDLLGLPVVFNNSLAVDQVLFGEFDKYTLIERESITIDNSEHVKFVEDQTAFRGKGRYDGKPTNVDAFVLVTIKDKGGVAGA